MRITQPTKISQIKRDWHLVDVKNQVIGRVAPQIAGFLMGKVKPYFAHNLDCGDYVVVVNSAKIKSTGNKEKMKKYRKHSGYPGGFKEITLENLRIKNPRVIVEHAVKGMLPDNKLKKKVLTRLFIYSGVEHPYGDKFTK